MIHQKRYVTLKWKKGITLVGILVAIGILGVILVPAIYYMASISQRYGSVNAKKSVLPLADELKVAVALDLKTFFTTARANPPIFRSEP